MAATAKERTQGAHFCFPLTLSAPALSHKSPGNRGHCLQHRAPAWHCRLPHWSSSQMEASTHCNMFWNDTVSFAEVECSLIKKSDLDGLEKLKWNITHCSSCLVSTEMRRADNGVTWMIWSWSTLPQKNDCWSDTKPGISVSSTSSPFKVRTLKEKLVQWVTMVQLMSKVQQLHTLQGAHRVCPTNASTSVLSNLFDVATRKAHIPLMPGRSMDACSWIPIPLRIILREPSLYAPIIQKRMRHRKGNHAHT